MADNIVNNHKYDAEYISYIRNGNSAAVLITRDLVKSVNTIGKWIDIIESNIRGRIDGRINFNYFIVEIFPRKTKPDYSKAASEYDKKYYYLANGLQRYKKCEKCRLQRLPI